jgi:hypothetical protein
LQQAKAQLEAEAAERQQRYQQRVADLAAAARVRGQQPKAHYRPRRRDEAPNPNAAANTTDPDSRFLHTRNGTVQGYNAQAMVTEQQIVVAVTLTQDANDVQQLAPMLQAADQTLGAADIHQRPQKLLADSGCWSIANLTTIPDAPDLLVWPSKTGRTGKPRKDGKPSASRSDGLRGAMFAKLGSEQGRVGPAAGTKRPLHGQAGQFVAEPDAAGLALEHPGGHALVHLGGRGTGGLDQEPGLDRRGHHRRGVQDLPGPGGTAGPPGPAPRPPPWPGSPRGRRQAPR